MSEGRLSDLFICAHLWVSRGWSVVPVQPDSKRLVPGFGIYQDKARSGRDIAFWWLERRCNLAVVAPESGVILDFDDIAQYDRFTSNSPELAASYTESTPRGGRHVFLESGDPLPKHSLIPGIEVKKICVVYPSRVSGREYKILVAAPIRSGDVQNALKPFILSGGDNSPSAPNSGRVGRSRGYLGAENVNRGIIAKVKNTWSIASYLRFFEKGLNLRGRGRWLTGLCPWHGDTTPSLWVDTERGLWGCHACGAHGDIVNWHARRLCITDMKAAAFDLDRYQVQVSK